MLLILLVWCALALGSLALGALTHRCLRILDRELSPDPPLFDVLWLGVCAELALLQLVSCVAPVNGVTTIALAIVAAAGIPLAVRLAIARVRPALRIDRMRAAGLGFTVVVVALGLALAASQPTNWYDTISTHGQQVKWTHEYGAVVGLANLNPKLGFDSSIFVLAAATEPGRLAGLGFHFALGFLSLVAILDFVFAMVWSDDRHVVAFAALTLPFLLIRCGYAQLPSYSSDLAMAVLALAATIRLLTTTRAPAQRTSLVVCGALAAAAMTAKPSALILTLSAFGAIAVIATQTPIRWRLLAASASLPALLLLGTFARRVILTGWLFYPAPSGQLPLAWTVPRQHVLDQYHWIRSWARMPSVPWQDVLDGSFLHWFVPWYERFRATIEYRVALFIVALAWTVAISRTIRRRVNATVLAALIASLGSLVYWALLAPDVRFGGVFFWMLFALLGSTVLDIIDNRIAHRIAVAAAAMFFAYIFSAIDFALRAPPGELPRIPAVAYRRQILDTDQTPPLVVNVPDTERCGDAPLPCTNYQGQQRWRVPGRLDKGFLPFP